MSVPVPDTIYPSFSKKLQGMPKSKDRQSEETKHSSETDSNITQMLELSNKEFKINMIDMLGTLMEK